MQISKFIEDSATTAIYPGRGTFGGLSYIISGLAGEIGEVFEVLKKIYRDSDGIIVDVQRIKSEVGDILWYWSQLLYETNSQFKDDTDIDDFQKRIFSEYLGKYEKTPTDDPGMLYQQLFLLSQAHIQTSEIFNYYNQIRKEEDFPKVAPKISQISIEIFKSLCIFLMNIDIQISEVMQMNLDKLSARKKGGKLQGSGEEIDER